MTSFFHHFNWQAPDHWQKIKTIEMHTGGEPLRIPVAGLPAIKGNNVLEKRRYFQQHYDHLRTSLMFEPRGHADMYGAIVSSPSSPDADFDVFFLHNEGYSTMCGHAIIALTKFVCETGLIPYEAGKPISINVPAGRVYATAQMEDGKVKTSTFWNVPSFLYLKEKSIDIAGIGHVQFDVAFGGAFYAIVEAAPLGLALDASAYNQLIDYGKRIKNAIMKSFEIRHPEEGDLSFLYGTIFTGAAENPDHHSRNVCIFAEGEVDRSATGSGVSARIALHHAKGEVPLHKAITIESILGSTMTVEAVETVNYHHYQAVVPKVSGSAHFCGQNTFWLDPDDPYQDGFIFR